MTVQEDLNAVADPLEERGWCQGVTRDFQGRFCLGGAIGWVLDVTTGQRWKLARQEVQLRIGTLSVASWNDTPGRTVEEVLAVLRGRSDA